MSDSKRIAVLGVGMHPWGKWGRNFVEYGLAAARVALADAGVQWRDIQFVSGADTIRNGYPGFIAGATFAQALGWTGARVSSVYAACASGAAEISVGRGICASVISRFAAAAMSKAGFRTSSGMYPPEGRLILNSEVLPAWL